MAMQFPAPLTEAVLLRRYKRFLADVRLADGRDITAHCPNPGAMLGLDAPGARAFVSMSANPKRKLPATLELVEADGGLVGINTMHPNTLAEEALRAGLFPALAGFGTLRREVKYGENSRIDILLDEAHAPTYVEVKNVHLMRQQGLAEFPDCKTARGAKHLRELAAMVEQGRRAAMVFIVQRGDCDRLALARDLDPAYADAFSAARARGVEAYAAACHVSPEGVFADRLIEIAEFAA